MSHQTTSFQTLLHLLNGYIGSCVLLMPKAFADGGFVVGLIGTPIIGLIMNSCIHMLLNTNELLCNKFKLPLMDYEEIAEKTFAFGPKCLQKFSKYAKLITTTFILMTQLGACCIYYLFIADNIKRFAVNLNIGGLSSMSIELYLLALLPIMILLNCIKSIKHLAIASTGGSIMQLAGLVIIIYNVTTDIPSLSKRSPVGNKLAQFFVTTVFSFEGISVTMPLYRSMKEKKNFNKLFGVLNATVVILISLYSVAGFLGYLKYGESVESSITLSLPNEPLYDSVTLMYAIAVIFTYPIIMFVPIEVIWPNIKTKLQESKKSDFIINVSNYLFRALLVIITFAMAALIPKLELIVTLVGSISSSSIAIIIPPILHTIAFWEEKTGFYPRIWLLTRNMFVTGFGCLGFATGLYFSINDIIKDASPDL